MPPRATTSHRSACSTWAMTVSDGRQALWSYTWTSWPSRTTRAARRAMPYGTWRGSSSSRMRGLTKSTLAMVILPGFEPGRLEECLQRHRGDAVAEEQAALGAVEGLAVGLAGHFEKDFAEPVIGRVAEPDLARHGILGVDEGLAVPGAQELDEFRVVLGLLVRRAGGIAQVDAHEPDAPLAQRGMGQHPGRRADIAAAIETGQAILLPEAAREAIGLVVIVIHRVPPVELHARLLAALHHRGRRRGRDGHLDLRPIRVHQLDEGAVGVELVPSLNRVHLLTAEVIVSRSLRERGVAEPADDTLGMRVHAHHDMRHEARPQARPEGAVGGHDGPREARGAQPLEAPATVETRPRAHDNGGVPGPELHLSQVEDGTGDARPIALGIGEPDARHALERRRLKRAGYLSSQLHRPSLLEREHRDALSLFHLPYPLGSPAAAPRPSTSAISCS